MNCAHHSDRRAFSRGLCSACYSRAWRAGQLPQVRMARTGPVGQSWLWPDGLPARIVDVLEVDAPLTVDGVSARFGTSRPTAYRALHRLRQRGLVVSRAAGNSRVLEWTLGHE